ncbi:MAG: hypothetical protein AAFV95_28020 [Bacteroidota bacterium]
MKTKLRKYWPRIIQVLCILLLVLPISETYEYQGSEVDGVWSNDFVLNNETYAAFYLPLIAILLLIPRLNKGVQALIVISVLLSIIGSLLAFQLIVMPIQDFSPHIGLLLTLFLSPLLVANAVIEWRKAESE